MISSEAVGLGSFISFFIFSLCICDKIIRYDFDFDSSDLLILQVRGLLLQNVRVPPS